MKSYRESMKEARELAQRLTSVLQRARIASKGDMLTRNSFLMSVKTFDLIVEAEKKNGLVSEPTDDLYNSHDGE